MRSVKAQLEHYSSNELKAKVTIYKRVRVQVILATVAVGASKKNGVHGAQYRRLDLLPGLLQLFVQPHVGSFSAL